MHPGDTVVQIGGLELDRPLVLPVTTGCPEHVQSGPLRSPGVHQLRTGARVPGAPQVLVDVEDEGAVSRTHELLAGPRQFGTVEEGAAAAVQWHAPVAVTATTGTGHHPSMVPGRPATTPVTSIGW